jgi:hypothetical protein
MHWTRHELPCIPTERFMALCTPHLVTSVDFTDTSAAARTGFRLRFDKLRAFDILLLAFVPAFFFFGETDVLKAFGAGVMFAQLAFVFSREIAATLVIAAGHNEFTGFFFLFFRSNFAAILVEG